MRRLVRPAPLVMPLVMTPLLLIAPISWQDYIAESRWLLWLLGTARAYPLGQQEGVVSSLVMMLSGVVTVALAPVIGHLMRAAA